MGAEACDSASAEVRCPGRRFAERSGYRAVVLTAGEAVVLFCSFVSVV